MAEMILYVPTCERGDGAFPISDMNEFLRLIRELEHVPGAIACPLEIEGGTGSTLLNCTLPDFTPEEERAILEIYETACDRTIEDCNEAIRACWRKKAELQGFKIMEGGAGHDLEQRPFG